MTKNTKRLTPHCKGAAVPGRPLRWAVRPISGAANAVLILWLLGILLATISPASLRAEAALPLPEYKLKAGYLYNLCKFIEWPGQASVAATNPIVVGILGGSNTVSVIEATLRDKTLEGRSFCVKSISDASAASSCQILFVTRDAGKSAAAIRQALGQTATLLVGETERFAESGGMVGFVSKGETIRFTLNPRAAAQVGIKLSAKLAYVALPLGSE